MGRTKNPGPLTAERSRMVADNIGLVGYALSKVPALVRRIGSEDAYQWASLVLCRAVRTFDPTRNVKLSTHFMACFWGQTQGRWQELKGEPDQLWSINVPCDEDGNTVADLLLAPDPETGGTGWELVRALDGLEYRQRCVLLMRYGLGDGYRYTLSQCAKVLGMCRERIRQLENTALAILRKKLDPEDW